MATCFRYNFRILPRERKSGYESMQRVFWVCKIGLYLFLFLVVLLGTTCHKVSVLVMTSSVGVEPAHQVCIIYKLHGGIILKITVCRSWFRDILIFLITEHNCFTTCDSAVYSPGFNIHQFISEVSVQQSTIPFFSGTLGGIGLHFILK